MCAIIAFRLGKCSNCVIQNLTFVNLTDAINLLIYLKHKVYNEKRKGTPGLERYEKFCCRT